ASGPLAEYLSYRVSDGIVTVERAGSATLVESPFFEYLERQLAQRAIPAPEGLPFGFNLGYVGYLGYELKAEAGAKAAHQAEEPDAAMVFADRLIAVDHVEKTTYLLALSQDGDDADAKAWLAVTGDSVAAVLSDTAMPGGAGGPRPVHRWLDMNSPVAVLRHDRDAYLKRIQEGFHEIHHGESYQAGLNNEVSRDAPPDPLTTYSYLRRISPVPYGAFLDFPGVSVLCASPERFLSIGVDRVAEAKPIKGTRPRGATPEEDAALKADLFSNQKDQ